MAFTSHIRSLSRTAMSMETTLKERRMAEEEKVRLEAEAVRKKEEEEQRRREGRVVVPEFDPLAAARENREITRKLSKKKKKEAEEAKQRALEKRKADIKEHQRRKDEAAAKGKTVEFMGMYKWVPAFEVEELEELVIDDPITRESEKVKVEQEKLARLRKEPWVDPWGINMRSNKVAMRGGAPRSKVASVNL